MTLSIPIIIFFGSLGLMLLLGCILFALLGMSFKAKFAKARDENSSLYAEIQQISEIPATSAAMNKPDQESEKVQSVAAEKDTLLKKITVLEQQLKSHDESANNSDAVPITDNNKLKQEHELLEIRMRELELTAVQAQEESAASNAAAAKFEQESKTASLEKASLEQRLATLTETLDAASDSGTMREMIVNFTEESRELLQVIEQLGNEKAELHQTIADMELGGKGTAGAVVGLKRRLAEAEETLSLYKVQHGDIEP